jgi:hypothetical protein
MPDMQPVPLARLTMVVLAALRQLAHARRLERHA